MITRLQYVRVFSIIGLHLLMYEGALSFRHYYIIYTQIQLIVVCGFCGNWRFELVCGKRNAPKQNQMVRTVTWLFILVLLVLLLLLLPLLLLLLIKWCCRVAFWPKRPLLELLCQVYVMYCELWRLWYGKCGYDDLLYTYALIIMYKIACRWIDWLMDGWMGLVHI